MNTVSRLALVGAGVAALAAIALATIPAARAQGKQPPACAAIKFRPIPAGMNNGEQDAGLYRSRFGLLEVKGTVQGGQVTNYYVTVNNKKLDAAGTLPKEIASCAQTKHLPAPGPAASSCTGDRLQVLIDHVGDKRYVLLYVLQSAKWQLCSAGTA
jgi:hypothetical protein